MRGIGAGARPIVRPIVILGGEYPWFDPSDRPDADTWDDSIDKTFQASPCGQAERTRELAHESAEIQCPDSIAL